MTTMLIAVENKGADIIGTNYWETEHAMRGLCFVSINAGCFRLLVPEPQESSIAEMATAKVAIVSRGPWPKQGRKDAFEILFEDGTDSPFSLCMSAEQFMSFPFETDQDCPGQPPRWTLTVWTQDGKKKLELPCRYRLVREIPCLEEFPEG
jgi:hypothetical protein